MFTLGQNSGKEVFVRKSTKLDGVEYTQSELEYYQQKHEELQKRFLRVTLRTLIKAVLSKVRVQSNEEVK